MRRTLGIAVFAALTLGSVLVAVGILRIPSRIPTTIQSPLRIAAARYPRGFTFTNLERNALRECVAWTADEGRMWTAYVVQRLEPSASATVVWSRLKGGDRRRSWCPSPFLAVECYVGHEKVRRQVMLGILYDQNTPDQLGYGPVMPRR